MLIYVGFDDTDTIDADRGTGRLAREFAAALPEGFGLRGVVRQQLPRLEGIPYTANNSSACVLVEAADDAGVETLIQAGAAHLAALFIEGSDPGLCVAPEGSPAAARLVAFGRECCHRKVTQDEARAAASGIHLSGHGGTEDGIIGAAAGVGLTMEGWSGRCIQWGDLRDFPDRVSVGALERAGVRVVAVERDAVTPWEGDIVDTEGWLRPRLWGGRPVLAVRAACDGCWIIEGRRKAPERNVAE